MVEKAPLCNTVSRDGGMTVQEHWEWACSILKIPEAVTDEYWSAITRRYAEKQRFYHTIDHIQDLFNYFDEIQEKLQHPALVAMAIFFHDVIYEPKEKDNEEKSAELFQAFIQAALSLHQGADLGLQNVSQLVVDWILATKSHKTDVHTTPNMYGESDLHYFLDMDMAILGQSPEDYKEYADKIRKEYIHYEEDAYRQGRAKVLKSFLTIPNIYATKIFREKYEAHARANIEDEIRRLLGQDK